MHLRSLKLTRFRSCDEVIINFQPDLTVLVGENNGGKSNIIDGIRLLTLPLNGRRDRYPEKEDLIIGKSLGHKSSEATQIYARLNLDPVQASIEKATNAMFGSEIG